MNCPTCAALNPDGATVCASCGSSLAGAAPATSAAVPFSPSLPPNSRLKDGAFAVKEVLGQGGFGITYKGGDMQLRRYVAIKEFFPQGCARHLQTVQPTGGMAAGDYQNVKAKFLEEARVLARFNHPGIARVFATFEENNTAYMVMEYLEGKTLQKLLEEKGALAEKDAVSYIEKVGEALTAIHAVNLIHRDLKPDNIVVTTDGRVVLIDFGTARAFAAGKTIKQTAMLTPGYAPLEQYGQSAKFGAYSDIYALGATLYHCLTGQLPSQATDRATGVELKSPEQINPYVHKPVSDAVMWAMQLKAADRPQTIQQFLDALKSPSRNTLQPASQPPASTREVAPLPTQQQQAAPQWPQQQTAPQQQTQPQNWQQQVPAAYPPASPQYQVPMQPYQAPAPVGCLALVGTSLMMFIGLVILASIFGGWISWAIVIGTTIWVGVDASNIGVQRGQLRGLGDSSVSGWVVGCLILWIVVFPAYLLARPTLRQINGKF